jgi:hypothetical protein
MYCEYYTADKYYYTIIWQQISYKTVNIFDMSIRIHNSLIKMYHRSKGSRLRPDKSHLHPVAFSPSTRIKHYTSS